MDDLQKSRVRLSHWIDHNLEHLKGYEEVAQLLEKQGSVEAAGCIREGMRQMKAANQEFEKAAALLPLGDAQEAHEGLHGECGHHHGHGYEHTHGHSKDHDHEH